LDVHNKWGYYYENIVEENIFRYFQKIINQKKIQNVSRETFPITKEPL